MERSYIAFISYRHKPLDIMVAKRLHSMIEQYRIPRGLRDGSKRLGLVFRDQEELSVTYDLSTDIRDALDHSQFLILVCTPDTPKSEWIKKEIDYFLKKHDHRQIIAVLADGDKISSFPYAITHIVESDNTIREIDPLAADIRAKKRRGMKKKLRRELLRILSAMLQCPYDALALREQKRIRQRMTGVFSIILSIVAVFLLFLLWNNVRISRINDELEERNRELAQQRTVLQLNESQLLTDDAQDALRNGNPYLAIQSAVKALSSSEDPERPYYPPAEQILLSALDVFNPDATAVVSETVFEQDNPIERTVMSNDGSRLITLDSYGILLCFDVDSQQLMWEIHIEDSDSILHYNQSSHIRLFHISSVDAVIGLYEGVLFAYSIQSGALLWTQKHKSEDYVFLTPDQTTLVYLSVTDGDELFCYNYDLVFLSTQTGELFFSIPLLKNASAYNYMFDSGYNAQLNSNGTFSPDGRFFVGSYYEESISAKETGNALIRTTYYFIVDLERQTSNVFYHDTSSTSVYSMVFYQDINAAIIVMESSDSSHAADIKALDVSEGTLLWESQTPVDKMRSFFSLDSVITLHRGSSLILGCEDRLYEIDMVTGEVESATNLSSNILSLFAIDRYFFGFVLDSGYYAVGWIGGRGFSDSFSYRATFNLGSIAKSFVWNRGFIRGTVENESVSGFRMGEGGDIGYIAVVPKDNSHQVIVKKAVNYRHLLTWSLIRFPCDGYMLNSICDNAVYLTASDGSIIMRSSDFDPEAQEYTLAFVKIDPKTHQTTDLRQYRSETSLINWLLPDVSGYINHESNEINLTDFGTGSKTTLCKFSEIILSKWEDITFAGWSSLSESSYRTTDHRLLTVKCDDNNLTYWIDGHIEQSIKLSDDYIWSIKDRTSQSRLLRVGANGCVVISQYSPDTQDDQMSGFAVYNTYTREWHFVEDFAHADSERLIQLGTVDPVFAVVDVDQNLRIYDIEGNTLINEISFPESVNSIRQIDFILNDRFILMYVDEKIMIYSVESGEVVYKNQSPFTSSHGKLQAFYDEQGQRLYIVNGGGISYNGAVCIDLNNWYCLAEIERMICYVPETNEIYLESLAGLYALQIPRTAELINIANKICKGEI